MDLKQKLKNNEAVVGTWIQIGHTEVVEILANGKFDWLCVDLEHGIIDLETASRLFCVIEKYNKIPIARVPSNDPVWISRVLDAGAKGIIIPMIKTVEDMKNALDSIFYPPTGKRGYGYSRANLYGKNFDDYIKKANDNVLIIPQIEHIESIDNLEDILCLYGGVIDATFVGPYDLTGSFYKPGDFECKEFEEAIKKYVKISKKYNVPMGMHVVDPSYEDVVDAVSLDSNFSFVAIGTDTVFLRSAVENVSDMF